MAKTTFWAKKPDRVWVLVILVILHSFDVPPASNSYFLVVYKYS